MTYQIYAIGPKHDPQLRDMIEAYEKRLTRWGGVSWTLLPYASQLDETARRAESAALLQKIKDEDYVVLLDERGKQLTSPALATQLNSLRASSRRIVFVIGGAYGVDEALRVRADLVWSLSLLVFPHQIVRLVLIEQLYRAHAILENHPYHHS